MSDDHLNILLNIEKTYLGVIDQEVRDKEKLENELDKMMEFKFATMRVDNFPQDCSDLIVVVIEKIKVEIESKSYNIKKFNKDVKDGIFGYFDMFLRGVELSQELKDIASKYGYTRDEKKPKSDQEPVHDHLKSLLQFEQMHANEIKNFEYIQQELQTKKDHLLECRKELVAVNCTEMESYIANIDVEILDIDRENHRVGDEILKLQDIISVEIIEYTKKFMFSSQMIPEIQTLLQKYGINPFTLANNSIHNDSQISATTQFFNFQPKKTESVHEILTTRNDALHNRIEDLEILIQNEIDFHDSYYEIKAMIDEETKLMNKEMDEDNFGIAEMYIRSIQEREQQLKEISEAARNARCIYAEKYYEPELRNEFVEDVNILNLLYDLIAEAKVEKCLEIEENSEKRSKKLAEDLSKQFYQALSLIPSTSTSANFDGLVETEIIDPKKDEEDAQDVDGELEDASKDNNNNQA